jgi:hypothetical protein
VCPGGRASTRHDDPDENAHGPHICTLEKRPPFSRVFRRDAYFNNDWEGFAVRNGLWLRRRLGV